MIFWLDSKNFDVAKLKRTSSDDIFQDFTNISKNIPRFFSGRR